MIATPTGKETELEYFYVGDGLDDVILVFEEVKIKTKNDMEVLGYRVKGYKVQGSDTLITTNIPLDYQQNCHGFALFGDGDLWFLDIYNPNVRDVNYNEIRGMENMRDTFYQPADENDATLLCVYDGDQIIHSAKVNQGIYKYIDTSSHGEVKYHNDLSGLLSVRDNLGTPGLTFKYYKPK